MVPRLAGEALKCDKKRTVEVFAPNRGKRPQGALHSFGRANGPQSATGIGRLTV